MDNNLCTFNSLRLSKGFICIFIKRTWDMSFFYKDMLLNVSSKVNVSFPLSGSFSFMYYMGKKHGLVSALSLFITVRLLSYWENINHNLRFKNIYIYCSLYSVWTLNPSSLLLQISPEKQMGGSGLLGAQNPFLSGIKQERPNSLVYICK